MSNSSDEGNAERRPSGWRWSEPGDERLTPEWRRPSRETGPLWTHPGVWTLLALGYCTPGAFFLISLREAYYSVAVILVLIGTLAAGRRGRTTAGRTAFLMVLALIVGFIINAVWILDHL